MLKSLRLTHIKKAPEQLIHQAQIDKPSYLEFILSVLEKEVTHPE
ncbi:hypothetical protein [Chondrinema litorale]